MTDLTRYAAVLLDLDGTVYHDEYALPGAVDLIRQLQSRGARYACLTNSTNNPARISARLERMGVVVDPAHIYSAAAATADYVLERFASIRPRLFNLATRDMEELLEGRVEWVQEESQACDAVLCGVPVNVCATFERQRIALALLRKGAALIGICADRVYPSPRGVEFGVGALSAMLAYAADVRPVFCGKPEPIFFHELCSRLQVAPSDCVLIGDNLESDIGGGRAVGMRTILTLSGIAKREEMDRLPADRKPDATIQDLRDLVV